MTARSVTVVLDASSERAFEYLSDVDNLPRWATEFARELRYEDGKAKVVNGLGEFFFSITADRSTGVIDMHAGATEDQLALFPTRVVGLPEGRSAYTFTMFQGPGMPDELFESQHASLQRELDHLARLLAAT